MAATKTVSRLGNRLLLVLLTVVSLLALLPEAIGFGIRHWLGSQGIEEAYLLDVDFNPFSGELRLENLHAKKATTPALALWLGELDVDWWPLTRRQAVIKRLSLSGLELTLEQDAGGGLSLNGIPLPGGTPQPEPAAPAAPPWGIGVDSLEIADSRITLKLPDFKQTLIIERLSLSDLRSWEVDQPASVTLQLLLDNARLQLDGDVRPFAATRTLQGKLRINRLDLAPLAADLEARLPAGVAVGAGHLDLDLDLTLDARTGMGGTRLAQRGNLALSNSRLTLQGRELSIDRLAWQGQAQWSDNKGPGTTGELRVTGMTATEPDRELLLARLEALHIPTLQLAGTQELTIDALSLQKPVLLAPLDNAEAAVFRAGHLQLGQTSVKGVEELRLGEVVVHDARLQLTLGKDGKPEVISRLQQPAPAATADESAQSGDSQPRIALAGLQFQGDSRLSFHDLGAKPPFKETLVIKALTVGPLDSKATKQPTPFDLKGRIGEYSDIRLNGDVQPLAGKLNLTLKGDIKAVELPPLSSYTGSKLGYNLQSGQLDADINLRIREDQLDGEASLVANKLRVKVANPDRLSQLTTELAMPLDSALNMLRDSDDNIRLKLPVSGDVHSPDFDLSHVINKAMGKAMQTAALAYVKHALQPYGTLLTLAQYAGKKAQQAALQAVTFSADSSALSGDAPAYLGKLTGLLTQRPQMRISICGHAVESDRQARIAEAEARRQEKMAKQPPEAARPASLPPILIPDEQLLTLAKSRAEVVKRDLVNRGIAPERLFLCNPELDKAAEAAPRVDLLL